MKLGLGTVQFGLDYGISNQGGRVPVDEVTRILALASESGVRVLDTAAAYGTSEEVLGQTLPPEARFDLVTKTLPLGAQPVTAEAVERVSEAFRRSLSQLKQDRVYGLLVHQAPDLLAEGGERLWEAMQAFKQQGLVQKIGVSVYSAEQIDRLEALPLDLIQLPINVLDQRLVRSGHLAALKRRGVEIHVRSAFLQGLLLMPPSAIPPHLASIREHLAGYHATLEAHGLTPAAGALAFLQDEAEIDEIIVGVTTGEQLRELIEASRQSAPPELKFGEFAWSDERILDPSKWQALKG